jgi:hypothetical protein
MDIERKGPVTLHHSTKYIISERIIVFAYLPHGLLDVHECFMHKKELRCGTAVVSSEHAGGYKEMSSILADQ